MVPAPSASPAWTGRSSHHPCLARPMASRCSTSASAPKLGRLISRVRRATCRRRQPSCSADHCRGESAATARRCPHGDAIDGDHARSSACCADHVGLLDRDVSLIVPMRIDRRPSGSSSVTSKLHRRSTRLKPGRNRAGDGRRHAPDVHRARRFRLPRSALAMFEKARITPEIRSMKDDLVGERPTRARWAPSRSCSTIACANVANLLLVRAESRRRAGGRAALGADSRRIVRELLMESMTLAVAGGVVGLGLAFAAVRLLVALEPGNLPRLGDITVDLPVLTSPSPCRCCRACCSASFRRSSRPARSLRRRCGPAGGPRAPARSASAPATCSSSLRSRWPWCSWSARG